MELSEQAEELLETLWVSEEEQKKNLVLDESTDKTALKQLMLNELVITTDSNIKLTAKGRPEASNVVRRHRLAERLLADVLGTKEDSLTHDKACRFEHLLDRGLDDNICTLLGHPRVCPHGKPIPPGRCCQQQEALPHKLVSSLSGLVPGQKGKVAYIYAPESGNLQKLIAMGIYPGAPMTLIQNFPSYVFQAGQTQFAVDREIADAIYIRLTEEELASLPVENGRKRRRWGPSKLRSASGRE